MNEQISGLDHLIEALTILKKYDTKKNHNPTFCAHDIFLVFAVDTKVLSVEDEERLEKLGFFWNEESECWGSYRFGSC